MSELPDQPNDGWEPGVPSLRAMAPSLTFGAVVPLVVYFVVRRHVHGDAAALAIAGAFPAAWVLIEWARRHRLDPIGSIVLFGFMAGLLASYALGGNAFVLKIRESLFSTLFGIGCLLSLTRHKPLMFYMGRALSAGDDPERIRAYDELWELPTSPHVFKVITVVWGFGLLCEAGLRVLVAALLPTGTYLAVAPIMAAVVYGSLFFFTVRYTKRARLRGEAAHGDLVETTIPEAATLPPAGPSAAP